MAGIIVAAGAVVGGTAIALGVHHSHHTLKGCVTSAAGGLEMQTQSDSKTYLLAGSTAGIQAGDSVLLHGTKQKMDKHSTGEQTFSVENSATTTAPERQAPTLLR